MFWDFGSAVSSQQQAAADHVQTAASSNRSNRSSGSERARRPTTCLQVTTRSSREIARGVTEIVHALVQITTQSSNRLRKVQTWRIPTSSLTETSSLSATNVSVVRRCCSSRVFHWQRSHQNPPHFFPEHCEVWRWQSQGFIRQCRVVRRNSSSSAHLKHYGEGVGVGSVNSFALPGELLSWLSGGEVLFCMYTSLWHSTYLPTSTCHRCTSAFGLAPNVPQNRVAFDMVAER